MAFLCRSMPMDSCCIIKLWMMNGRKSRCTGKYYENIFDTGQHFSWISCLSSDACRLISETERPVSYFNASVGTDSNSSRALRQFLFQVLRRGLICLSSSRHALPAVLFV